MKNIFIPLVLLSLGSSSRCLALHSYEIVGGDEVIGDEDLIAATAFLDMDGHKGAGCSGARIDKHYVLTAAHCVYTGVYDATFGQPPHDYKCPIKQRIVHPQASLGRITENDVALLRVECDPRQDKAPKYFRLPGEDNPVKPGDTLSIAGYGKDGRGDFPWPRLSKLETEALDMQNLLVNHPKLSSEADERRFVEQLQYDIQTQSRLYLALTGSKRTGTGDSGGPIYRTLNGVLELTAVVSERYCNDFHHPDDSSFAVAGPNVLSIRDWIISVISGNSRDSAKGEFSRLKQGPLVRNIDAGLLGWDGR